MLRIYVQSDIYHISYKVETTVQSLVVFLHVLTSLFETFAMFNINSIHVTGNKMKRSKASKIKLCH